MSDLVSTPHVVRPCRKKLIDAADDSVRAACSLQVRASRRDSIALGIENREPITVVALAVKCKLESVIAMCAGCHLDAHEKPQGRCRHEFLLSSVLRAEHQVGLGEGTTFENEHWAASQPKSLADTAVSPGHVRFTPRIKWTAFNQHGDAVYTFTPIAIVPRRPS